MKKLARSIAVVAIMACAWCAPAFAMQYDKDITSAIMQGADTQAVRALIEAGSSVNQRREGFMTPLMAAASKGQGETIKLLLEKGADPRVRITTDGLTLSAFDFAIITHHWEVFNLLPAIGPDGKTLEGRERDAHIATVTAAYKDHLMKTQLNRIVATLDPIKVALTLYYQEHAMFPSITGTVYPTDENKPLPPDSVWGMAGFTRYPVLPPEVASIAYVPSSAEPNGAESFGLIIKLTSIKPGSIDGQLLGLSPTDDLMIQSANQATLGNKGIRGASAIIWFYSCHEMTGQPLDAAVKKRFANHGQPLECR